MSCDGIVTKGFLRSGKIPFHSALLLLFTCGINILFFIFSGTFTDLFPTLFISRYYIYIYIYIYICIYIHIMNVSLDQWRAVIGIFNCGSLFSINSHSISLTRRFTCFLLICILLKCLYLSLLTLLNVFSFLLCNWDTEPNPGPRKFKQNSLSICHWNLNSLSVHNFAKLTQLKTYNLIYKHDFICLSETYLYSATPKNLLEVKGYNLVWVDHLKNIKRGGVCIYYKESSLFEP